MSAIEELADALAVGGRERLYGVPGSGPTLSLIDALERRGLGFVTTHSEAAAVVMAGTEGRLSDRPGVSLSIKGPGLANAVPGLAIAGFESLPLVHLTEAYAPDAPAASAHKRLDQASLVSAVAKGRRALEGGPGFAALADWARAEEPGPVVLELTRAADETAAPPPPVPPRPEAGDLLALVRRAERPLVIAGGLACRQAGWPEALARLGIPVLTTAAAKGLVDEALPQAGGIYTGVGLDLAPERRLLAEADLVVGLGLRAKELLRSAPLPCPAVNLDLLDTPGSEAFAFAARGGLALADELFDLLGRRSWGLDSVAASVTKLRDHMQGLGFLPPQVFEAIDRRFDRRQRCVLDTGYFCTMGEHALRPRAADLCLFSGQGRYMGTALPMALGAALTDLSVPTVAVLGDGGIGYFLAELSLAVERRLPLLVVLMTDGAFGSIRTRARAEGLTQKPLAFPGRSWCAAAAGLGLPAERLESLPAVEAALAAWDPATGPAFLEIAFPADPYEEMVRGIR